MHLNGIADFNEIKTNILTLQDNKVYHPDFIFFCLDFDGTLVRIRKSPLDVYAPLQLKKFLKKLTGIKGVRVCIITGRALKDIENRLGILNNIIYSGNHGFEIKSYYDDFKIDFLVENTEKYIIFIKEALSNIEKFRKTELNNLIIEDKKFSVSMHYRLLNSDETKILKKYVKNLFSENLDFKKYLHVTKGKKIIEIRPKIEWNKGKACDYILKEFSKTAIISNTVKVKKELNILRINIGDDITDETMFVPDYQIKNNDDNNFSSLNELNELNKNININVKNINCVVGNKKSQAQIYLESYKYTPAFIENILYAFNKK
ncbi:MAG: trehalose-phosphatase [Candidatus Acidulodesulfobacterium sp.]